MKSAIAKTDANVQLLTGLDFMQTEPTLLREWVRLAIRNSKIEAKLASKDSIFHPKVIIVTTQPPAVSFAIVGSGNLTKGGFCTNTECGLYIEDSSSVGTLCTWFDSQFGAGSALKISAIAKYEPKFKKARKATQQILRDQKEVQKAIAETAQQEEQKEAAVLRDMERAIGAFMDYKQDPQFKAEYESRLEAAESIRHLLDVPRFNFDRKAFDEFYKIGYLGSLRDSYRNLIFKDPERLRKALRLLVDESIPIEKRMNSILERGGSNYVPGLGRGGVTKILAATYPIKWPVLNGPVVKTLADFGYKSPKGLCVGERYRELAKLMGTVRVTSGAPDVIALDAFFKFWELRMNSEKKKSRSTLPRPV
jgi:hypothetical protein